MIKMRDNKIERQRSDIESLQRRLWLVQDAHDRLSNELYCTKNPKLCQE
jgi:hypothetical protein